MIGLAAPEFELDGIDAGESVSRRFHTESYRGRWLLLIFYHRDFSFVCPTELTAFSARIKEFRDRNCDLMGISVDTTDLHREWLTTPVLEGGLGPLRFPLASDPHGETSRAYGVWLSEKEASARGMFIIDPSGNLQYSVVHNLSVGRSVNEVLRVLDALGNGGLCPANWTAATGTIKVEAALYPGRVLGQYRIREQLGSGTFGTVVKAWDRRLKRLVALKVLNKNIVDSRGELLFEARTAARLNHPNVCTIFAIEKEEGVPIIVMEFIDGQPLTRVIEQGLDRSRAIRLAVQVAAGLAAAHEEDVPHGNLKPANIMVGHDDSVRILDFGLTRSQWMPEGAVLPRDSAATTELPTSADTFSADAALPAAEFQVASLSFTQNVTWETANLRGTPAYMSPEQSAGQATTAAGDVFAFGLILYELVSGRRALGDNSLVEILAKLGSPNLAHELAGHLPDEYRTLLTGLLAHEPQMRLPMNQVEQQLGSSLS